MREDTETVWKAAQMWTSTEKYLIEFQKEENKESVEKEHWKRDLGWRFSTIKRHKRSDQKGSQNAKQNK